jgi:serine/threonine-protein kinase
MTLPDREIWKRLSPLLDEMLELDRAAQTLRLAELRGRDSALADELALLLSAAGRAGASIFLAGDAIPDVAAAAGLAGTQIGAYVIEAPLGEGGTGSVWRARRADGRFEGSVAVKLLHLSLIGRAGALRFEQEGVILARLVHPNIARLLDAGVTAAGQPYLVLELVEGQRIDWHCNALRLDVEQRLNLFADVLAAVAHAHSHLVIHRDIKPNNILVSADGKVKLLDFGIAKLLQEGSAASPVTVDGQRVLTPEYAAPEQLQGGPVTTATDVYALGVLLYHLLAGHHPTAANTASSADMMRATLDTEPMHLATVLGHAARGGSDAARRVAADRRTALPRLRRQLQGDLDNIVARALRKGAAQRYQTIAALAEDLRRHLAHEPVSARPDSLMYRCAKFARRRRGLVAAGALLAVAVAAGLAGTVTQARRAEAQAATAQQERDHALRQLAYAKSSNEFITFLLQEGSDKPFTTTELLARAEPVLDQQFADDPAQRAHLQLMLGSLYVQALDLKKAQALLLRARADARGVPDLALQAQIECQLGYQHGINRAFDSARPMLDAAIARLRAAPDTDHTVLAACLQFRGEVAELAGDVPASLADAQAALEVLGVPRAEERVLAIVMRSMLAGARGQLGQSASGAAEYRRAIQELEAMGRGRTRQAGGLYNNLGVLLARAGQTLSAVDAYRQALDIAHGLGGADPELESNYANRLIELGRTREAISLIEHAQAEANARGLARMAPLILVQGARAWCVAGDLARCAEQVAAARSGVTGVMPAGHSMIGRLALAQGQLALAQADLPQARTHLRRAVEVFDTAADKDPVGIRALTWLARTEHALGESAAARSHATQAVTRARDALGGFAHSEWLGSALVAQAMAQQARGEFALARASGQAAVIELQATVGDAAPATTEARRLLLGS